MPPPKNIRILPKTLEMEKAIEDIRPCRLERFGQNHPG